jgi:hypothetical protein
MLRISVCLAAMLLVAGVLHGASAQTATPAPAAKSAPAATSTEAKPSRIKLTVERLKEMRAQWIKNRACRAEVRSKGLTGDDRWFYIEDCMDRP